MGGAAPHTPAEPCFRPPVRRGAGASAPGVGQRRAPRRRSGEVRESRHPALGSAVRAAADPATRGSPVAPCRPAAPAALARTRAGGRAGGRRGAARAPAMPRSPGGPRSLRGRAQLRSGRGRGGAAPTEKKSEGGWVGRAARSACSSGPRRDPFASAAPSIAARVIGAPRVGRGRLRLRSQPGAWGRSPHRERNPRAGGWGAARSARSSGPRAAAGYAPSAERISALVGTPVPAVARAVRGRRSSWFTASPRIWRAASVIMLKPCR